MEMIAAPVPDGEMDLLEAVAHPPEGVGVVELRGDLFPGLDPAAVVGACPLPVLFTSRSVAEGGRGPDDPATRAPLLRRAWEAGCAFLDLEAERDGALLAAGGFDRDRIILSWHEPGGTPPDLEDRATRLLDKGTRWVKIIPTARSLDDLETVLRLHGRLNRGPAARRRLVVFAMGAVGQPSRYLAPLLGPPLAYVAWDERAPAAPGQVSATRLRRAIGHLEGPPRALLGVIGRDVTGSRSPQLHGAAYAALGLPWALLPFSVPDPAGLEALFRPRGETMLDGLGLAARGWAVTTPYKEAAARAATLAAPRVRRARSANTLLLRPGRILADTTDPDGVVGALTAAGLDPGGLTAVVQGTGGAGRAVAVGLELAGAATYLRGRDAGQTRAVATSIGVEGLAPGETPAGPLLLVNATPLGSTPEDPLPFRRDEISRARAVVDMVYGPEPTPLERAAEEEGVFFTEGLDVLLHQGIAQIAAFTGKVADRDVLREALRFR